MEELWPWVTLALLGAYHGLNPAMGWLFAVALGMQERSRSAVICALGPIALGHGASVAAVVAVVSLAQSIVPLELLQVAAGGALVVFGLLRLLGRASHPSWVGMRVGPRDLVVWSFLMSTAHGAGLMLVPVLLRLPAGGGGHADAGMHTGHAPVAGTVAAGLAAVGIHTVAMFLIMGLVAVVVFEAVGLAVLRRSWFNLDRLWAVALIAAGVLTLVL